MKCKLCQQFYKDYPLQEDIGLFSTGKEYKFHEFEHSTSSPIQCAFEEEIFSTDNWNCQTMIRLRELCGEGEGESNKKLCAYYMRYEDESIGVLPIFDLEGNAQEGYLIITWYKSRGKTGRAYVLCDMDKPRILTLETAEAIVARYKKEE